MKGSLRSLCELRRTVSPQGGLRRTAMVMAVLGAIALSGCKEEPLQAFDGVNAISFKQRSMNHTFWGLTAEELPSETIRMAIRIIGTTTPYDRTVSGVAFEDPSGTPDGQKQTTATPSDYRILGGTIPAGEVDGWFYVELMNHDKLATDELRLRVVLTENEHFVPGLKENLNFSVLWSQKILQPDYWNQMRSFFCATYSTQCFKAIIQATGRKYFYYVNAGPDPDNPEHVKLEAATMRSYGAMFGNYIRQYNAAHPNAPMQHDDGPLPGTDIIPIW